MYNKLSKSELESLYVDLKNKYQEKKDLGLKLDMSRGKPAQEQLPISNKMNSLSFSEQDYLSRSGVDVRNYGILDGIVEAKEFFAKLLEIKPSQVIVGGNSSLQMMFDAVSRAMTHGIMGSTPWSKLDKVKFLCPVPGYDRHFAVTEFFGIEMILIPMNSDGPDMNLVREYVENDESVKGIWNVPKYSNPSGITYSDDVVKQFANLKPKAKDFRIFWDNAYFVHDVYSKDKLANIITECENAGNPDIVYQFTSTSKVTFPGAGISVLTASEANIKDTLSKIFSQTIGSDKLNQLRHVKFFTEVTNIEDHMKLHANMIRPKFDIVKSALEANLTGKGIAEWTNPNGGYFISVNVLDGTAKRTVQLCKEAGLVLTGAGATFPYGKDPDDKNIRIAPTYPSQEELKDAADLFCICVQLSAIEKLLNK